jgi:caa(3)-type oxidase subunit IV
MLKLLRTTASAVWLLLVALTVTQWMIGTHSLPGLGQVTAALVIFVVAVFKARLVGLYFMELRDAPLALRSTFEATACCCWQCCSRCICWAESVLRSAVDRCPYQ